MIYISNNICIRVRRVVRWTRVHSEIPAKTHRVPRFPHHPLRPFAARSTSRRRDNHINRAITCLCISIIPWRCVDPGQDTGYILRVLSCSLFLCLTHTQTHTRASRTSRNLELSSRLPGGELKLGQKGESREKLQRTTLISLIELSTRDCCNYDYL